MRALRVLAVNEAHGCGEEASVAHDVCRPEHAALTTACVAWFVSWAHVGAFWQPRMAYECTVRPRVIWPLQRALLSLPQTRLLAPQLSNPRHQQSVSSLCTFLDAGLVRSQRSRLTMELEQAEDLVCFCSRALLL